MQVGDKVLWGGREAVIIQIQHPINKQGFYWEETGGYYTPPYLIEFKLGKLVKGVTWVQEKFLKEVK